MNEQCIDCGHEFDMHHLKNGMCQFCIDFELDEDSDDCTNICDCEPEQCKMIKGMCKNLAYR